MSKPEVKANKERNVCNMYGKIKMNDVSLSNNESKRRNVTVSCNDVSGSSLCLSSDNVFNKCVGVSEAGINQSFPSSSFPANHKTSITAPRINRGQPSLKSLCQPIQNYLRPLKAIKKKNAVQKALVELIEKTFKPTHFFTITLPDNQKTTYQPKADARLKRIMTHIEWKLLGRHWHKKHLEFVAVAEKGHSGFWHYHILFNRGQHYIEEIEKALTCTEIKLKLPSYTFKLLPKYSIGATEYCVKEIKADENNHYDGDVFILSDILFGLPSKIN